MDYDDDDGQVQLFIGKAILVSMNYFNSLFFNLGSFRRNIDEDELYAFIEDLVPASSPVITLAFNRAGTARIAFVTIAETYLHSFLKKDGIQCRYGRLRVALKH